MPNQEQKSLRMSAQIRDPNCKSSYVKPKDTGVHYNEQLNQFISKTENNDRLNYSVTHKYALSTYFMSLCPFHT